MTLAPQWPLQRRKLTGARDRRLNAERPMQRARRPAGMAGWWATAAAAGRCPRRAAQPRPPPAQGLSHQSGLLYRKAICVADPPTSGLWASALTLAHSPPVKQPRRTPPRRHRRRRRLLLWLRLMLPTLALLLAALPTPVPTKRCLGDDPRQSYTRPSAPDPAVLPQQRGDDGVAAAAQNDLSPLPRRSRSRPRCRVRGAVGQPGRRPTSSPAPLPANAWYTRGVSIATLPPHRWASR
jgi:hypothetical protein